MPKPKKHVRNTLESAAYLGGLFTDFSQQMSRYKDLTGHAMSLEARLVLAEKTLVLTRDHLKMALDASEGCEDLWKNYQQEAAKVRFVGMRLIDACEQVMAENKKLTPEQLLDKINNGTFRFRTNAPLREIHAALLRHPHIKRIDDFYIWSGPKDERLAVLKASEGLGEAVLEGEIKQPEVENKPN